MNFKIFGVTTVAAMAFSGATFAQTMIGDQELSAGDLPAVTAHCEMLAQGGSDTAVVPGNSGNPDNAGLEPGADATDFGTEANEADVVAGNSGNPDQAGNSDNIDSMAAAGTDELAPDANSGNPDAETDLLSVNLQMITLEECQAAGIAS